MDEQYTIGGNLRERRRSKYAVVTFLPRALSDVVAPLRERFDPAYNLVAPHITLVFPFDTVRPLDELAGLIKSETENEKSIQVQLESIGDFYPKSPVIFWSVRKNQQLTELYFRLHVRLNIPIPYKNFVPHVTVASEISHHRLIIVKEQIASYLAREKFHTESIDLITPLVSGKWVSVRTFPLKGYSDKPSAS
ncbi:MAG: 2'-5' RNA ligase family protein [Candidatus Zixiibacteriota bacterium]|nr:MAG: 2'-5' RNA ligase family protein [candidate division Zixibacteria bacterium]